MNYIGFLLTIFIGISLGLIGGGGSILTVPVLVYFFKIDPILATVYSLFIVGITSVIGSVKYIIDKLVNIKIAVLFGIPSIISVLLTRIYLINLIPQTIFFNKNIYIKKSILMLLLFAILMIIASYNMIKKSNLIKEQPKTKKYNYLFIIMQGLFIGFITGLIGAGGGFIIIPSLILLFNLSIKKAIGTSLIIISANSLFGFFSNFSEIQLINWNFLFLLTFFPIIGIFIGIHFGKKIDGSKLKPLFGWFILIVGVCIIFKEIINIIKH